MLKLFMSKEVGIAKRARPNNYEHLAYPNWFIQGD